MKLSFHLVSTLTLTSLAFVPRVAHAEKGRLRSTKQEVTAHEHNNRDEWVQFEDHFDIERDLQGNPHCSLLLAQTDYADGSGTTSAACSMGNGRIYDLDWPESFVQDMAQQGILKSGRSSLSMEGVQINNARASMRVPQDQNLIVNNGPDRRNLAVTTGNKIILAVRVIAADASTGFTEAQLSTEIFGTGGTDSLNLKGQYEACSYGAITVNPKTGTGYNNGVTTVTISNTVSGTDNGTIRNAVSSAVGAKHGNSGFVGRPSGVDHVMQCLPPGTSGGWIAYAYIDYWLSVYNNDWCTYPSAQMHEIGHNLALAHANEGSTTYADQTGMMGYSYRSDEGPRMCFNAPKNYQLGWYSNKHVDLSASSTTSWSGRLVGIADYGSIKDITDPNDNRRVIVRFNAGSGNDYYFAFNRQTGINSGTQEGGNQVTVTLRPTGTGYAESNLQAKLNAGGTFSVNIGGQSLSITVNSIVTTTPGYADVSICYGTCAPPTTAPPTPPPTDAPTAPTEAPTPAPTRSPTTSQPTPPCQCANSSGGGNTCKNWCGSNSCSWNRGQCS